MDVEASGLHQPENNGLLLYNAAASGLQRAAFQLWRTQRKWKPEIHLQMFEL